MELSGKVALITGASGGIGESIAVRLASLGMKLLITGRNREKLEQLKEKIEKHGSEAHLITADISAPDTPGRLIEGTIRKFGGLDLLVNNAGLAVSRPIEETDWDDWEQLMAVNARAPFFICQKSISYLRLSSCATIINISSVVGRLGYTHQAAYAASKHALMGFSKVLAREVQPLGIRVHTIAPGGVATEMVKSMRADLDQSELIQPEEIADIVEFLLKHRGNAMIDNIDVRRFNGNPFA
ncbi:MAG: Short-chain dehydrogenase/reductase SDR [Proteiniphilum sp. 51_7]|jgi:3-oxoacyl-[acyl-carrier protein] reductase|nr:MAG: Short-chain dehydrogenase/reductase SDR [Proteiniphilum sp. 51_7]MBZ4651231.1 short-chain dehydrogenase/reductase [Proteiniphilum sp.]